MLEKLWKRIAYKLTPFIIDELQIGAHCGLCGKWVPDIIIEKVWAITLCEDCKKSNFT